MSTFQFSVALLLFRPVSYFVSSSLNKQGTSYDLTCYMSSFRLQLRYIYTKCEDVYGNVDNVRKKIDGNALFQLKVLGTVKLFGHSFVRRVLHNTKGHQFISCCYRKSSFNSITIICCKYCPKSIENNVMHRLIKRYDSH